jgi:hypothetical protein
MVSIVVITLAALYLVYVIKHSELLAEPRAWLESDGLQEIAQKARPKRLAAILVFASKKVKYLAQCNLCLSFWACLALEVGLNSDPYLANMASGSFMASVLRVLAASGLAALLITWSFNRQPNYRTEDVSAPF